MQQENDSTVGEAAREAAGDPPVPVTIKLITLADAADLMPVTTRYPTVHKWATAGIKIGDRTVRLRTQGVGCRLFTTLEWLTEFQAEIDASRISDVSIAQDDACRNGDDAGRGGEQAQSRTP